MNAVLQERREASVLTYEAIEVHLSYLRPVVEALQAELPALRKEIRTVEEKLSAKIEALDEKLTGKIDSVDQRLSGRIDKLSDKFDEKFDKLTERMVAMEGNVKGLILFLTVAGLLASGISIAHSLSWI